MGTATSRYRPGALVKARGRDWVVIPSDEDGLVRLRPVDGVDDDANGRYQVKRIGDRLAASSQKGGAR